MAFLRRSIRSATAGLLAAAMLFAQSVYAIEACVHVQSSPAAAVASEPMPGCNDGKTTSSCLAQCTAADQNLSSVQLAVPPAPAAVALLVALPASVRPASASALAPDCASDPPAPILFCSLLL
ncbi:MAG TPA: hypothetical protein VFB20_08245 [Burkholderiales bacterium]|nr:hypothetical protein [Burkholderiales bacterium]